MSAEPWATRLIQEADAGFWLPYQEIDPGFQMGYVAYGPSLLEGNHDAGRRFMAAYLKAVQQYNEGKTERNLEILAEYTGLDRELLKEACWPSFSKDGTIHVQSVFDFQDWALGHDYLDSLVAEEQFWNPSFVQEAKD